MKAKSKKKPPNRRKKDRGEPLKIMIREHQIATWHFRRQTRNEGRR